MDLLDVLKVLGRRWLILAIGVIVTVGAGLAGYYYVPTNYQATGQFLLLLPPEATGASTPINPYLNLDPGLTVAASLIASTLNTAESHRGLEADGYTSEYSIALDPGTGPLLQISVEDTDPQAAIVTRDEVMKRLSAELVRIQSEESVPKRQFIHYRQNSVTNSAEAMNGSKVRALGAIGAIGATVTLLLVFSVDRLQRARGKRRSSANPSEPDEPEDTKVAPTLDDSSQLPDIETSEAAADAGAGRNRAATDNVKADRPGRSLAEDTDIPAVNHAISRK